MKATSKIPKPFTHNLIDLDLGPAAEDERNCKEQQAGLFNSDLSIFLF